MNMDDLFKKRRRERRTRRYEFKTPRANSFLIVTEGERTEPFYFKGLKALIQQKVGGVVDIVEVPVIEVRGEGVGSGQLIKVAEKLEKNAKIIYQNIWIVFDKDDFPDFDIAIKEGASKGYHIAWSNQSFEYWLYLHFHYSDSALTRDEWSNKLKVIFRQKRIGDGCYRKNDEDIYNNVNICDGVAMAIKNANRRMKSYRPGIDIPSEYDPGTMVHILVAELRKFL